MLKNLVKRPLVEDFQHLRIESLPKPILADIAKSTDSLWVLIRIQYPDGCGERCQQRVQLVASHPHFGGIRWWFVCPETDARCRILYLAKGRDRLVSRAALNATYRSQRQQKFDRAVARAQRLRIKLSGVPSLMASAPPKPKWMRWRTYRLFVDRITMAEKVAFGELENSYRKRSQPE